MFSRRAKIAHSTEDTSPAAGWHANAYPGAGQQGGNAHADEEAAAFERELLAGINIDLNDGTRGGQYADPAYAGEAYDPALYGQGAGQQAYAEGAYDPNAYQQGGYGEAGYDPNAYDPNAYAADGHDPRAYDPNTYAAWPDSAYPDIADGDPYAAQAYAQPDEAPDAQPQPARRRPLVAAALGVIALGAIGAVGTTFLGGVISNEPVLVAAPTDPYKIMAAAPTETGSVAGSAVFPGEGGIEERIVPRDEAAAPLYDEFEAFSPTEGGPRRVRTVVVRPDGSIVETPLPAVDAIGSVANAPVDAGPAAMPAAPEMAAEGELPSLSEDAMGELAAVAAGADPVPVEVAPVATVPAEPLPTEAANVPAELEPAPDPAVVTEPAPAPTEIAAAPTPVPTADTPAAPGSYVQVASQRSEAAAQQTFADLQRRFPAIFAGQSANIQRADLGDRGVYYRLRVGPMASGGAANDFCSSFRSAGGDCLVVQN